MLDSKVKKYRDNFKYVAHKGAAGMNTASMFVQLFLVTTICLGLHAQSILKIFWAQVVFFEQGPL